MNLNISQRLESIIMKQRCYGFQNKYTKKGMNVTKSFNEYFNIKKVNYPYQ